MTDLHDHNIGYVVEFQREKREQRRQILILVFLGWLLCLLILQVHHPPNFEVIRSVGDLNVVWDRFVERLFSPFLSPETFTFGIDALGGIIGSTATVLIALVFSGRNPLEVANETQRMALDELLELLTFLVGIAAAATMWMAWHNVAFLPDDPDSGPKFFLGLLCLMLVIFSVVRQRDVAAQRALDEIHLTTSMRRHIRRWERMWGVSARNRILVQPAKILKLALWWLACGLVFVLATLLPFGGLPPLLLALSAVALLLIALVTATLTAAAVSLYRSNPHPGAGLGYALVLIIVVVLTVASPFAAASGQNPEVFQALLGYFLWLTPSVILIFRKPPGTHLRGLQYTAAPPSANPLIRALVAAFDGARECAYWVELVMEARRQKHYEAKLAALEEAAEKEAAAKAEAAAESATEVVQELPEEPAVGV